MQTNEVTLGALERRIDMSVTVADVEREVEARLKKLSRTVKMPGFRPGKVPFKIVSQTYGPQARSEAIGAAVEKAFGEKVREQNLRVAGYPRIEAKPGNAAEVLEFSATFEVYPEIALADISGKSIERPVLTVGEAEVDRTIEILRKQRTTFEAADRAAEEGDRVTVDFVGKKDGEPFQGGTAEDFPFVIGAGNMLADFESQVKGLKAGDSKTFDLTFPAEYQAQDLAGKTVQFEVAVKKVEAPKLPEVDGEFAKTLGVADGDVAKMREEVKANLEREVRRRIQARVKEQAMNLLLEANPVDVPKALVETESAQLADNARQDFAQRGMDVSKMPIEPAWFADQAVRRVKLGLVLAEVVKKNELHAKPEQIRAMVDDYASSFEDPAEVVKWYYSQPQRLAQAEAIVIEDNVVEWVLKTAQATDTPVAFDELMGNNTGR
ncbi:trigger factor [Niveibacterium microcysteis]|uniref:Trigger factor n=1 Tax=Niveibacterium microcysteis TaxID=2811415 RepID=A0ABX7M459_9RHOO|nr:trigger factor [Niveibacterium microcysteis]QSI75499.1 trigger factor [Niveibacterium microcysteis]